MKRTTAVRHLQEMAERSTEMLRLKHTSPPGWPLLELWVTGELLEPAPTVEVGSVVLVLDVPTDDLPLLTRHIEGEWVGHQLRLGKRPLSWSYRPAGWPVWNHQHRRLTRFWTTADGADSEVIEALRSGRVDDVEVIEPSPAEVAQQVLVELPVSRQHLRRLLDKFYDRDWRRAHSGDGHSPQDHLWRAATAVADLWDAADALDDPQS